VRKTAWAQTITQNGFRKRGLAAILVKPTSNSASERATGLLNDLNQLLHGHAAYIGGCQGQDRVLQAVGHEATTSGSTRTEQASLLAAVQSLPSLTTPQEVVRFDHEFRAARSVRSHQGSMASMARY
jgi:hypothetical protein